VANPFFTLASNGSLGLGTISPQAKVDISGANQVTMRLHSNYAGADTTFLYIDRSRTHRAGLLGYRTSTSGEGTPSDEWYAGLAYDATDAINNKYSIGRTWYLQDAKLVIDTAGNVGIGATTSGAKLHVRDTGDIPFLIVDTTADTNRRARINFAQNGVPGMEIGTDYSMTNTNDLFIYNRAATQVAACFNPTGNVWFNPLGNIGIGTTLPTGYKLVVNGNINAIGNVYASGVQLTSDQRLKRNIQPLNDQSAKLTRLRAVSFEWNKAEYPDRNLEDGRQLGVIAQEIEKVYPELVSTGKDGYKSVNYNGLFAPVIETIKEQQAKIEKLEAEIELLKKK
jgi:hypothetical protein